MIDFLMVVLAVLVVAAVTVLVCWIDERAWKKRKEKEDTEKK